MSAFCIFLLTNAQALFAMGNLFSWEVDISSSFAPSPVLSSCDLDGIIAYIRQKKPRNVIVMSGAGISVAAGIPDFRSPGMGLYDNLQRYDLPEPEAIFDRCYFAQRPDAFYSLAKDIWPGERFRPTLTHHFIALLHEKGLLRRNYTQNIDSLELAAGLPKEALVQAHGSFQSATCIANGRPVPIQELRSAVQAGKEGPDGWQALADRYGGFVKPDITFFGEALPARIFSLAPSDFSACDLLLVLGTSLQVEPFASLVEKVPIDTPRLVINRTRVGLEADPTDIAGIGGDDVALHFGATNHRNVELLGDCDEGVQQLATRLGWSAELEARVASDKMA